MGKLLSMRLVLEDEGRRFTPVYSALYRPMIILLQLIKLKLNY